MAQTTKIIEKIAATPTPKNIKWSELVSFLAHLGYQEHPGRGSRMEFHHAATGHVISLHRPHPGNEVKTYVIRQVLASLASQGLIQTTRSS